MAGSIRPIRIAMMAITTSTSISVKPQGRWPCGLRRRAAVSRTVRFRGVRGFIGATPHPRKLRRRLLGDGGLRYHEGDITVGAQTGRRGGAGPVRGLLGGKDLTGRF